MHLDEGLYKPTLLRGDTLYYFQRLINQLKEINKLTIDSFDTVLLGDKNLRDHVFFFLIFIVIQLQLYAFSPHPSTPPQLKRPPSATSTLTTDFVHVSFIVVPVIPSSHCPHPTPPWLLLDCS